MSIASAYQTLLATGQIKADPAQSQAVEALSRLAADLTSVQPPSLLARLLGKPDKPPAPRGLYLYGPVGRGKSMLMDLFFEAVPVAARRRVHFHAFMLEVHDRIHGWRKKEAADPLAQVAADIAAQTRLLCFDEFQVTDVADAMILGRLFTALFKQGVVMVATSNTAPESLYEGGLQRALFLPFITLLRERCVVQEVAGPQDYRRLFRTTHSTYLMPDDEKTAALLEQMFLDLTRTDTAQPVRHEVKGHVLTVPRAAHGTAWFTFADLCEQPLGSVDYNLLAGLYHTFFLAHVPAIHHEARDVARRFITLIDMLYDHKCKLVISAAVEPEWIYGAGSLVGEFARTVSRLHEMQSEDWWAEPHRSDLPEGGA